MTLEKLRALPGSDLDRMAAEVQGYEVYTHPSTLITVYRVPESPHVMRRASDLPYIGSLDGASRLEQFVIEKVGWLKWSWSLCCVAETTPQMMRADARTRVIACLLALEAGAER